jgi:uncharacterized protein YciI
LAQCEHGDGVGVKIYAVHFENDPAKQSVQVEQRQNHRSYLQRCGARIVSAGALHRDENAEAVGGLWLVRAHSELEVRGLIEEDPYFIHELRRTIRVWMYSPSLGEAEH